MKILKLFCNVELISVDDKMDNCLPAGGVGKLMNVCFHIINLYCSMSPRFLQESSKKRRSPKHLPCRTMLSILSIACFLWFNSWPVLPDLVSCSRPNGPNLVFYGPGNVWWSSGAPTIAHHCNNAPLRNIKYATLRHGRFPSIGLVSDQLCQ